MLSASLKKFVKSLHQKKFREQEQLFIVEGEKNVLELLFNSTHRVKHLFCTNDFLVAHPKLDRFDPIICKAQDLEQMGTFMTNDAALAVGHIPNQTDPLSHELKGLVLALDGVRDPGNMGTIIRLADWFGCSAILCSPDCVDVYNPKVLNASMGSYLRVKIYYCELEQLIRRSGNTSVSAELGGSSLYQFKFPENGILLLGNESKGVSDSLSAIVNNKIAIPRYGGAESLNVGMAAAVLLSWWRGQIALHHP